eukprot:276535-Pyramimonas_sp.AAC.1
MRFLIITTPELHVVAHVGPLIENEAQAGHNTGGQRSWGIAIVGCPALDPPHLDLSRALWASKSAPMRRRVTGQDDGKAWLGTAGMKERERETHRQTHR